MTLLCVNITFVHMKESIKNLREQHNYSQSYLATYLGISRQMYIKYEAGEVEPPVRVVVALAKLYDVSYSIIIDDKLCSSKDSVSYKINNHTEKEVASPTVLYSQNPYSSRLEALFSAIKRLPQSSIEPVFAFVKMLHTEQICAKPKEVKSKKAFFSLAGKIDLDSDSVTEFREASLI